ncbi:ATP-binding protein [Streptomyces prunicolor]|uniref:ATP-binding protein n=1 Tax=Streptomyces prunicolor TaxID=67348 RepID=UPI0022542821|nr:ATP-binding protein [Streptomyces prunicolor]MCX5233824.1 ATP-binding protein [Streptomyces prunicolor]
MPEMSFDFEGLIQMIANNLYSEKKVFIRELIQNAHDGIRRRTQRDGVVGRIDVETRPQDLEITIRDTGIGMNREDLEGYLSNIGKSLTKEERERDNSLIGQFGIGFLAAFVVASKVRVTTRKVGAKTGWLWENEGSKEYRLTECEVPAAGTTVTVTLAGAEDRGIIQESEVRTLIRHYADMLTIPIHLNGSQEPENTMHMPWERTGVTPMELDYDLRVYVQRTLNDRVLEVIPVQLRNGVKAEGVLYITPDRLYAVDQPRTIRLFQRRMFLCEDQPDILPKWARFINGVINTPDLTPTSARDNYLRDDQWSALRDALGDLVIEHLERLRDTQRKRFVDIARYHRTSFTSASYYYGDFFAKFADLLLWRTNCLPDEPGGTTVSDPLNETGTAVALRTLPEILERLPGPEDEPKTLQCVTGMDAARQYFEIANAAGTTVVDASFVFEPQLLDAYTRLPGVSLRLVHIDREDAPSGDAIFRPTTGEEGAAVQGLADRMSAVLRTPQGHNIRTEAREFKPSDITAVLRTDPRTDAQIEAEEVLRDPNASPGAREMAEAIQRMTVGTGHRLTINASNELVQRLAAHHENVSPEVGQLMLALYHSAVLANGQLITAHAAAAFHDQLQQLMGRSLEALDLEARCRTLDDRLRAAQGRSRATAEPSRSTHRSFFMITPFAPRYRPVIDACRELVEQQWGYELVVASERQEDHRLLDNVQVLMDGADGFIAEITDSNPNVMFELGAAFADRRERPVILLRESASAGATALPADLQALLYIAYALDDPSLAEHLRAEMWKSRTLRALVGDSQHPRYVGAKLLTERIKPVVLAPETIDKLASRYRTTQDWLAAEPEEVAKLLKPEDQGLAPFIVDRARKTEPA